MPYDSAKRYAYVYTHILETALKGGMGMLEKHTNAQHVNTELQQRYTCMRENIHTQTHHLNVLYVL